MPYAELLACSNRGAVKRLLSLVRQRCQTVLVEHDYADVDHRACHGRLYRFRHREVPLNCKRLHFFAGLVTGQPKHQDEGYLGFSVIRPLSDQILGRILLSAGLLPKTTDERWFVTCSNDYETDLGGQVLRLRSAVPWMQQDRMASACASAAMWVANWHLAHRLGRDLRPHTTPEITDLATRHSHATGRPMPSNGLTITQIVDGFAAMGLEPLVFDDLSSEREAHRMIYSYVESGIPVVLVIDGPFDGGHAVTIVGHSLVGAMPRRNGSGIGRASDAAPCFLVQDDAAGPFGSVRLVLSKYAHLDPQVQALWSADPALEARCEARRGEYPILCIFDEWHEEPHLAFLSGIVVPLPQGIHLDAEEADGRARDIATMRWRDELGRSLETLRTRTFLQPSVEFKAVCHRSGILPEAGARLERHVMPKWVWVTEIAEAPFGQGEISGWILMDAAGHPLGSMADDLVAYVLPSLSGQEFEIALPGRSADSVDVPPQSAAPFGRFQRFERLETTFQEVPRKDAGSEARQDWVGRASGGLV